jgi:hypothetical protein
MEKANWAKIKELFEAASDLEPSQREAFLRDACKGDEGLLAEVESLLIAHDESNALSSAPWPSELLKDMQAPKSIGP